MNPTAAAVYGVISRGTGTPARADTQRRERGGQERQAWAREPAVPYEVGILRGRAVPDGTSLHTQVSSQPPAVPPGPDCYNSNVRQSKTVLAMAVLALAWTSLCAAQSAAPSPLLESVKTVYFWPMHNSLDQYLAEQLSDGQLFQVVVDPKLADAIITERIDAPFLKAMDEVFGPPGGKADKSEALPRVPRPTRAVSKKVWSRRARPIAPSPGPKAPSFSSMPPRARFCGPPSSSKRTSGRKISTARPGTSSTD